MHETGIASVGREDGGSSEGNSVSRPTTAQSELTNCRRVSCKLGCAEFPARAGRKKRVSRFHAVGQGGRRGTSGGEGEGGGGRENGEGRGRGE